MLWTTTVDGNRKRHAPANRLRSRRVFCVLCRRPRFFGWRRHELWSVATSASPVVDPEPSVVQPCSWYHGLLADCWRGGREPAHVRGTRHCAGSGRPGCRRLRRHVYVETPAAAETRCRYVTRLLTYLPSPI